MIEILHQGIYINLFYIPSIFNLKKQTRIMRYRIYRYHESNILILIQCLKLFVIILDQYETKKKLSYDVQV